ncbi:MAG: RagB/SusD family nutrient uptake outer membrane protein [Bacteroidetes bacterium]|nr:RagB/SusD family nutrient uptake outer membrane protein [Bacteroidota bacterium]MBU1484501.1 RagB/SusD family nutrient uptake outer membrane protein [Bacteroidota bacterium]MBU2268382.1 RagB/SusD family nutrient uptake outer membrane protein [Bacteroidota bacterium]MBU2375197.1 RagB/SusD family nutrient uptake outer membrane protein [Bacteroidota bacterium]
MKNSLKLFIAMMGFGILSSCKDFLEVKPDQKLVIPSTLNDLQAINDAGTNNLYPAGMDNASDDFYLAESNFNAVSDLDAKNMYKYDAFAISDFDWQYQYKMIFDANVVLSLIDDIKLNGNSEADRQQVRGAVFFKRAHALFNLLVQYALAYDTQHKDLPAIPLRLNATLTEKIERKTLSEGFNQVEKDLKDAVQLLPEKALVLTRPSKVAALGLLSRVYLYKNDYQASLNAATEALNFQNELIDYNNMNAAAANPFSLFNKETLFYGISSGRGGLLNPTIAWVSPALYNTYQIDDLRKKVFYKTVNGGFTFKGDYSGKSFGQLFHGIGTDELYLNKAECEARLDKVPDAIQTITQLLVKRYANGKYVAPLTTIPKEQLVTYLLSERRKELAFRGMLRWMDFKRLKDDVNNRFEMKRVIGGDIFTIQPEDLKTAFLFPTLVVNLSGISQNNR